MDDVPLTPTEPEGEYRLDKTAITVTSLGEERRDRAYWLSRPPAERFRAIEYLRQMNYGYDPATARLQRILEVVELRES